MQASEELDMGMVFVTLFVIACVVSLVPNPNLDWSFGARTSTHGGKLEKE